METTRRSKQQKRPLLLAEHTPPNNGGPCRARVLPLSELTSLDREAWLDLEQHAIGGNPFLSPHFVLPAWRHLRPESQPLLLVVSRGHEWLGCGIFESGRPCRRLPVPHLRHWHCQHGYLQGLLLRQAEAEATLNTFWNYLLQGSHNWHAVEFTHLPRDVGYYDLLHQSAHARGVEMISGQAHSRPCLWFDPRQPAEPGSGISPQRQRSLRQSWNWLNRQGELEFQIRREANGLHASQEQFLELEALGWKSTEGTALKCTDAGRRFFREMTSGFACEERLFFTELASSQQAIGSVVHLLAGNEAYAFKLGWDPRFARGCPGYQMKARVAECLTTEFPHLTLMDSCACENSFIGHVWPGRRQIAGTLFLTSYAGMLASQLVKTFRWIRDCGRRRVPVNPSELKGDL